MDARQRLARFDAMNEALDSEPEQLLSGGKAVQECMRAWIALELLDENGQPVANAHYEIKLPSGEVRRGRLNSQGYALERDVDNPGLCHVSFPDEQYSKIP